MMKREKLKKNTVNIWSYIKNYKFNSMFIQSFLIVFVLFCIPFLLFSSLYYNNVKNATYEDIERESRTMLYEMRDLTDTVLIGAPVMEATLNNTGKVVSIWAGWDPLSWNVGWGVTFRFAGWYGHTSYFNSENVNNVANIVNEYIN